MAGLDKWVHVKLSDGTNIDGISSETTSFNSGSIPFPGDYDVIGIAAYATAVTGTSVAISLQVSADGTVWKNLTNGKNSTTQVTLPNITTAGDFFYNFSDSLFPRNGAPSGSGIRAAVVMTSITALTFSMWWVYRRHVRSVH